MNTEQQPVALITGSGRPRVGQVVAEFLARRGYNIAVHYNSSGEEAADAVERLRKLGAQSDAFQADVTDDQQVTRMVDQIKESFGRIDVLVNTSSIWRETTLEDVGKEELQKSFDVNALGTFFVSRAAGLVMAKQPEGGSIITIGDWSIERPYLDHVAYFIAKGTIPTLTRLLARELGSRNPKVRVNCIHPGPVMFPPDSSDERKERLIEATVVKSADCPEMVAQAVAAFVENKFVTGACLPVDGGRHMYSPDEV